mmetsp:Transcript_108887/g.347302  ORF Transcript_108887/g.347302 Transcript_108887/m.347302 type:complete len:105 (+) Transcript_108887:2042-2356(+)
MAACRGPELPLQGAPGAPGRRLRVDHAGVACFILSTAGAIIGAGATASGCLHGRQAQPERARQPKVGVEAEQSKVGVEAKQSKAVEAKQPEAGVEAKQPEALVD